MKQRVERDVERYSAAKRRRLTREVDSSGSSNSEECLHREELTDDEVVDDEVFTGAKRTISMQTDLTIQWISQHCSLIIKVDRRK